MRANFDIDAELWHSFRKKCLDLGTTASARLREFVQREVK